MAYHTHTRLLDLCSHLAKTTAVALAIYLFNRSWFILFLERVFYCSIAGFWDPLCFFEPFYFVYLVMDHRVQPLTVWKTFYQ